MPDLNKVLKGLTCGNCTECPYWKAPGNCDNYVRRDAIYLLKSQQAEIAELKPKEGHWEVFTMCANEGTYCSECHTKIFDFVTPPKRKLSMFCPHCGAKMSEERISR